MRVVIVEPLEIPESKLESMKKSLESKGLSVTAYPDKPSNYEEFVNRVKQGEILVLANIPLSKDVLEECDKLKYIAVAFSGVDHIDLKYCAENNIKVSNARGYSTFAVSELTIGLIIALFRQIPAMDYNTRTMKDRAGGLGHELYGKKAGIFGTGLIGSRVALLLKALGCDVMAHSRNPKEELVKAGIRYVSREELLTQSDIVSLHLALTPETTHFIGKEEIMMMKPNSILVNTARGKLVDTQALSVALKMGRIYGAAIDVFDREPPLDEKHPLRFQYRTVLTPHIGYATFESMNRRADIVLSNIISFLNGNPVNLIV